MMFDIPSINSLESMYMDLERPIMMGALRKISKKHGDKFPLIPASYYAYHSQMSLSPQFPSVIKVSHAHAGMGKIKVENDNHWRDVATIIALHDDYCTSEPFIDYDYGLRVQKVGQHYRVFKKVFTGSGWKSQFGGSDLQEISLTDEYKFWVDEASKCFGGMELLALDIMHGKDGKNWIIELNGTAIGFTPGVADEDNKHVVELVVEKMGKLFNKKK